MAGEEDGDPRRGLLPQQIAHLDDAMRVESIGRLVQDEQAGAPQQGASNPQPLLHPEGIGGVPIPAPRREAGLLQRQVSSPVGQRQQAAERAQVVSS